MIQTVLRRQGGFVVTPKGALASRDNIHTFRLHLGWGVLLIGALAESLLVNRPQTSMRLWSLTLIGVCLTPWTVSLLMRTRQRLAAGRRAVSRKPMLVPSASPAMEPSNVLTQSEAA